jgi:hypothetical protein
MHGHPGALQARSAVASDRGTGQVVVPEQDRYNTPHVEALLAAGKAAAEHQIVNLARVELRKLVQRRPDHQRGQVVGSHGHERALRRPADGGARCRDDHGFWH